MSLLQRHEYRAQGISKDRDDGPEKVAEVQVVRKAIHDQEFRADTRDRIRDLKFHIVVVVVSVGSA